MIEELFVSPGQNPLPIRTEKHNNKNVWDYTDETMKEIKE